jgi:hypothetical protein
MHAYQTETSESGTMSFRVEWFYDSDSDYERLRQFCTDQWHYCGIVVTLLDADDEPDSVNASLWGIESDCTDYHEEVINELIQECLDQITTTIGV